MTASPTILPLPTSHDHADIPAYHRPEAPTRTSRRAIAEADRLRYERNLGEILAALGLDLQTPGTRETPRRLLGALIDATSGYDGDNIRLPYFYSDQYDLGMEYRGYAAAWDSVVVRGDPGKREFLAFWLADGRVTAAMNANVWDVGDELQQVVEGRRMVDPERLADPDVPFGVAAADPPVDRAISSGPSRAAR